ncbi:MAG: radA, partial [Hyphomicrobiales bacterium]|nr:radA [Hyphomicrobiales bacterium]
MAKARSQFTCQNCGAISQRWVGRCESCGEWNSIIEENTGSGIGAQAAMGARKGRVFALEGLSGENKPAPRIVSGIGELDRVTGGGFVPGSVLLLGGEP